MIQDDDPILLIREMLEIGWDLHRFTLQGRTLTGADVAHEDLLDRMEDDLDRLVALLGDANASRALMARCLWAHG